LLFALGIAVDLNLSGDLAGRVLGARAMAVRRAAGSGRVEARGQVTPADAHLRGLRPDHFRSCPRGHAPQPCLPAADHALTAPAGATSDRSWPLWVGV